MNKKDLIEMGLKNLWRRKLRTSLTVLGVVIGTASIVTMLSLGLGLKESFQSQVESMGSLTTITVSKPYDGGGGMMGPGGKKKVLLDQKAVSTFEKIPGVQATLPIIETYVTILDGKFISSLSLKGVPPESMERFEFKVSEGRLLTSGDDMGIVFGGGIKDSFYQPKGRSNKPPEIDLMNDKLSLILDDYYSSSESNKKPKEYKIKSIGVLEQGDMDHDWSAYMPIKTLEKLIKEKEKTNKDNNFSNNRKKDKQYQSVLVKVDNIKNVKQIQDLIKEMGHEAFSLNDFLEEMNKTSGIIQAVLGGIGAVSLLVAAIGITNTMIMSIYERTKEIGVMKVIGASLEDIRNLFLLESAIIGFLGGIVGVMISKLLSILLNKIGPGLIPGSGSTLSIIPFWLILASISFSTLIGILSGYYPAKRAMSLSALEAIKTE